MKKRRTVEQRIADIIEEQALFDAAGVRNADKIAKTILAMIASRQQYRTQRMRT
jgi:hypothetical protein